MSNAPATILITGASSGIGTALALTYAGPGIALHLCGRDAACLQVVENECTARGAVVSARPVDVTDADAMRTWIEAADSASSLDLVIANAGIAGGGNEAAERVVFETNLIGVLNTVYPALDRMTVRGTGQIALISSIAGNRGLPSAPAYSAAKTAVLAYGEALRGRLKDTDVRINVVCPGFVRSRITDGNDFPMPFFMEADRAADIIVAGLAADRGKISFPWQMRLAGWIMRLLPSNLYGPLFARLPNKE